MVPHAQNGPTEKVWILALGGNALLTPMVLRSKKKIQKLILCFHIVEESNAIFFL